MSKEVNHAAKAVTHIIMASVHAKAGMHDSAHEHARIAYHSAQAHRDHLTHQEKHLEVAHFNKKIEPMFTHYEKILSKVPEMPKQLSGKIKKSETVKKAKEFLKKTGDDIQPINRTPGKDHRYDYKPFHQMTPEQQHQARYTFRHSKDAAEQYHYPFDKQTGQMVHGQRWMAAPQAKMGQPRKPGQPIAPPQASEAFPGTGKILPQHMPGAAVMIHSPGHEFHGRFGEVQQANPQMPGQIRLKVKNYQTGRIEDTYVAPHQVALKRDMKKSEEGNVVIFEKSRAALKRIKSPKES